MSFKSFLTEGAANYDWNGYLKFSHYLNYNPHALKRYVDAINAFRKGIEEKEIYNAEYKDHYGYGFSRGYEAIMDQIVSKVYLDFPHESEERNRYNEVYWANKHPVGIRKTFKTVEKFKNAFPEAYEFLKIMQSFPDMHNELKGYIKSGRKPNEKKVAAQAKFQAMVSHGAAKRMADVLRQSVENIRPTYEKYFEAEYIKSVENAYKNKDHYAELAQKKANDDHAANIRRYGEKSWYARSTPEKPKPWYMFTRDALLVQNSLDIREDKLKPDYKAILAKQAKNDVNIILEGFVAKNTAKLGAIVDKKQNMDQVKVVSNRLNGGYLENEILVTFNDGAKFVVYSKTIWKRSVLGKIFTQYPTRFKNVVLSSGLHMTAPDEEKMNKEFS